MTAKIVLSFAMQNHGSAFAHWLRSELMHHLSLYEIDSVYLDCVVSRNVPGTVNIKLDGGPGREKMISPTGARPIGAERSDWNEMFTRAMEQAEYMIFCYTPEYAASRWCLLEWDQFHDENKRRKQAAASPLNGIVLNFQGRAPVNLPHGTESYVRTLPVGKIDGGRQGLTWDRGDYRISNGDFQKLMAVIKGHLN